MGRLTASPVTAVAVGMLAALACGSEPSSTSTDEVAPSAPLPTAALQVTPDRLVRLELIQPGQRPVTLEVTDGRWRAVSPVSFPANQIAVDSMIAVLAEIEIRRRVSGRSEPKHRLGENSGIVVKTWTDSGVVRQFTVGASVGEETYIQRAGEAHVYAVRGRCRRVFEKSFEQLRHPVITQLQIADIERVVYTNRFGEINLVPDPSGPSGTSSPGRFTETSPSIRNFNSDRASKNVAVLAGLRAKGFVDPPTDKDATGLFREDTARATVTIRGQKEPLLIWIGARASDGRLHLRTSDSDQIYLVARHIGSSLIPRRRHLERSDEHMRELQAQIDAAAADTRADTETETEAHNPDHTHGKAPPEQVPPQLMNELRELAQEQRQ